jgi:hypothetical protein
VLTLTLKNISTHLHARLKESAKKNRRSLNSEILTRLERDAYDAEFVALATALSVLLVTADKGTQGISRPGAKDGNVSQCVDRATPGAPMAARRSSCTMRHPCLPAADKSMMRPGCPHTPNPCTLPWEGSRVLSRSAIRNGYVCCCPPNVPPKRSSR